MSDSDVCGVYQITHRPSGRFYVGSSKHIYQRWAEHRKFLLSGKHHNIYLQNVVTKYGFDSLDFNVLEECPIEVLGDRENFWIEALHAFVDSGGFVLVRPSPGAEGHYISEETRARMSKAQKQRPPTPPETRAKMARALCGRRLSPETRARISEALQGHRHSPETRAKLSAAARARCASPEARAKLAEANRGKRRSPESRARMSAAQKQRPPMSLETKAKMSEASRCREAAKKAAKEAKKLLDATPVICDTTLTLRDGTLSLT